ncbi:Glucokinase [bacterium HR23]|nr:Glucokinase [bacterium HR23]
MEVVATVDLGGTHIRIALVDRQGNILARRVLPTLPLQGPHLAVQRTAEAILQASREAGSRPRAVGISSAGPIHYPEGTLTHPPNLPGWDGFALAPAFASALALPAWADNDANLAALGEGSYGIAQGWASFAFIIWGTGIGGGLVLQGKLVRGAHGWAGEVGHMAVDAFGPPCGCGGQGCVEALAAGPAITRSARSRFSPFAFPALARLVEGDPSRITPQALEEADLLGEGPSGAFFAEAGRWLGLALASLANALDLQGIVIGGGVSRALHRALPSLRQAMHRHLISGLKGRVPLLPSVLGDDAGLLGAGCLAWEHLTGAV